MFKDARGNCCRELGWELKANGKVGQHRFLLGKIDSDAEVREQRVVTIWKEVEKSWERDGRRAACGEIIFEPETEQPRWDKVSLALATATAKGETHVTIEPDGESPRQHLILGRWQNVCPYLTISLSDAVRGNANRIMDDLDDQANTLDLKSKVYSQVFGLDKCSGPRLLEAIQAHLKRQKSEYSDTHGKLTAHGKNIQKQWKTIRAHLSKEGGIGNVFLVALDSDTIDNWQRYWEKRPLSEKGQPVSPDTVKNHVKRIREFLTWLNRTKEFNWRYPQDYERKRIRISETQAELAESLENEVYTIEELVTLWRYATPQTRLFICLALNCCFGNAEIASLQTKEIQENHIVRLRGKTTSAGVWTLFQMTKTAIKWWEKHRPASSATEFITNRKGERVSGTTSGSNRKSYIPNAWNRLWKRIHKNHFKFPKHEFGTLRDTGSTMIRRLESGYAASLALAHKVEEVERMFQGRKHVSRDTLGDRQEMISGMVQKIPNLGNNTDG